MIHHKKKSKTPLVLSSRSPATLTADLDSTGIILLLAPGAVLYFGFGLRTML